MKPAAADEEEEKKKFDSNNKVKARAWWLHAMRPEARELRASLW